jgi:lipoprotein signal peptidase
MRCRGISFSLLQSYEISIMYSPISIVNFLTIFVKKFYDERFLSLLAFVLVLNGCDDGDLIQEDITFKI